MISTLANHLRRRTTSGNWIPELDGLRFIAIASVILFHLHGQLLHHSNVAIAPRYDIFALFLSNGNRGVPLFFMISGFILARPFAEHHLFNKPRPALSKYFARRLTRLEPPYIVNLLFAAAALIFIDHNTVRSILPHLAASLVYLHTLIFHSPSTINSVAWSLEIEVQFYILAPLLTLLFVIRNNASRRTAIIALMLAAAFIQIASHWTANTLPAYTLAGQLQYFLGGLLFADLFLTLFTHWKHDWRWDLVSLAGWPAVFLLPDTGIGLWLPFLAILLYIAAFRGVVVYSFLRNTWVAVIGGMCYTIYLWHPLVMTAAGRICSKIPFLNPHDYLALFILQGIVKVAAVALVCLPFFLYLERPCMDPKWPQKLLNRVRPETKPSTLNT
ncbi:MAG: acyltransferase 3 [Acidobacteriaceae bacterium]|nr:acyltransferase 3 [Acidobacteriaceae bacterium]